MSFPRAKIKRFNEIPSASPSPAEYNVDLKLKPKSAVILQSERFIETKSPSISETGSTQSTPCFRTPTLIKNKKFTGSATKPKLQNFQLTDRELLHAKNIECKNKDSFIKELTEQLEELKTKIYALNCINEKLDQQKKEFEENISEFKKVHNAEINNLSKEHEIEILQLNEVILKIREEVENLTRENEKLKNELEKLQTDNEQKSMYIKDIEERNKVIHSTQFNLKQMEEERDNIRREHEVVLEEKCARHKEELKNIEFEMLKCVHDIQQSLDEEKRQNELKMKELKTGFQNEIEYLKQSFITEKEMINSQNITCTKQLEENMNEMRMLTEIQAEEKIAEVENYWKSKLKEQEQEASAILKECQAISEYNIIQSEIEKNEYKCKFETKTKKYNDLEKKYDDVYFNYKQLQASYSNVQNKLYRMIKDLREKEGIKNEMNKLLGEKQTYETTILRCQETINILKRRLTESDQDVEQLKNEISQNENKLLEYEHKFNVLSNELKEAQIFNDELELKNESTIKITQEEIRAVKDDLLKKLETIQVKSDRDHQIYKSKLEEKEEEKKELLQMIKEQQVLNKNANKLINDANLELEQLSSENCDYSYQVEILTSRNAVLQTNLENLKEEKQHWTIEKKEMDLKIDLLKTELNQLRNHETNLKYSSQRIVELEETCTKVEKKKLESDSRIVELEGEIENLKKKISNAEKINAKHLDTIEEQRALIAPFRDQLEAYELEMNNLQSAKDHMENEAKDLGIKYAQILGHQNHKQKIKYMVNLKSKNEDLMKANLDLEAKLRVQDKKVEKLRKENSELRRNVRKHSKFEDKENVGSPNRSFKCESPGPLRDLN